MNEEHWLAKYLLTMSDTSLIDGDGDGGDGGGSGGEDGGSGAGDGGSGDLVEFKFDQAVVEGVPENFIKTEGEGDDQSRVIDLAAFTKSWKDQQSFIQSKTYAPPDNPADYTFEASDDDTKANAAKAFKVDEKLGEDPIVHEFRDAAHKLGISQKQFQGIIEFFVNKQGPMMDPPINAEDEMRKLGADAQKQIAYVVEARKNLTANGTLDDDMVQEMRLAGTTAAGVKLLCALLAYGGGNTVIPKLDTTTKAVRRDELQKELRELTEKRNKGEISEQAANRRFQEIHEKMAEVVGDGEGGTSIVFSE